MKTQRALVMLAPKVLKIIKGIAKEKKASVSCVCHDLIHKSLELFEDSYLDKLATFREKEFNWKKNGLSHDNVWSKKQK